MLSNVKLIILLILLIAGGQRVRAAAPSETGRSVRLGERRNCERRPALHL